MHCGLLVLALVLGQDETLPASKEWLTEPTVGLLVASYDDVAQVQNPEREIPKRRGVFVVSVRPFSSADSAKLKPMDHIATINGQDVDTLEAFYKVLHAVPPGSDVWLVVKPVQFLKGKEVYRETKRVKLIAQEAGRLALQSITIETDPVTKKKTVELREHPRIPTTSPLELRFAVDETGTAVDPLFFATYTGADWVFTERITIRAGESLCELTAAEEVASRSVASTGAVIEVLTFPLTRPLRQKLIPAIYQPAPIVRFSGRNGSADVTLTKEQQTRFELQMEAYDCLKHGPLLPVTPIP